MNNASSSIASIPHATRVESRENIKSQEHDDSLPFPHGTELPETLDISTTHELDNILSPNGGAASLFGLDRQW